MTKFYLNDVVKTKNNTLTYITSILRSEVIFNNSSNVEDDKIIAKYKLFNCGGVYNENEFELIYRNEDELKLDEILENWIGKEFYSNVYGKCELVMIDVINKTLHFTSEDGSDFIVYPNGRMNTKGKIIIFPNEQIYKNYPTDDKCKVQWLKWYVTNNDSTYRATRFFLEDSQLYQVNIKKLINLIDKHDVNDVISTLTLFSK